MNKIKGITWDEEEMRYIKWLRLKRKILAWTVIAVLGVVFWGVLLRGCAYACEDIGGYTTNQWANAIYKAEGGNKTKHPYGILTKYRHTSPRQACINTVLHKYKEWIRAGSKGIFISYLASKYAPINSNTDIGTNQYWERNVIFFLQRG